MTVFTFKIFYEIDDDFAQERFVVAESAEEAIEKINAHFEKLHSEGFMKPVFVSDPFVELYNVIV